MRIHRSVGQTQSRNYLNAYLLKAKAARQKLLKTCKMNLLLRPTKKTKALKRRTSAAALLPNI